MQLKIRFFHLGVVKFDQQMFKNAERCGKS